MKKMMILAVMMVMTISANAMSYNAAKHEALFLEHYHNTFHFPGGHTPTADQFKTWYVPLIEKLLQEFPH